MSRPAAARRILFVHAHPDDETLDTGASMARYAADGAHVTLVTCTLGEEGEVLVPELAHLAAGEGDQLGGYRISELAAAMAELGVTDHRWLGGAGRWRDSGMMGLPENDAPRAFWRAPAGETVPALVAVIREVRPQVLVTYDERGGYGHPDHIQTHRVAMAAVDAAADPQFAPETGEPWSIAKVYWSAIPLSQLDAMVDALRGTEHAITDVQSAEDLGMGVPDELVTTSVDGTGQLTAKLAAMRAYPTQISVDGFFFALADRIAKQAYGTEHFRLVRGTPGPGDGPDGRETDLFAGLV
jgi:N-acetyl-1-D-myo-inositol-2-amino-2-deoxy-alpha-D-glucopyranoside deacetylase